MLSQPGSDPITSQTVQEHPTLCRRQGVEPLA